MIYKQINIKGDDLTPNSCVNSFLASKGMTRDNFKYILNPIGEHDPLLMAGMKEITQKLLEAIDEHKKITIVGDYDADGATSTSILYLMLKEYGAIVDFIVPHRVLDGYGLNVSLVDRAIKSGTSVILTCDNGISAHDAVEYAISKGVEILITDHHEPKETLPNATVICHPAIELNGIKYPFANISGCMVAYKIAQQMFKERAVSNSEDLLEYFMQLATISIVSDVMPVGSYDDSIRVNENRGILIKGLESMRTKLNFRLEGILKNQLILPKHIDETTIAFNISPIINAIGRIGDANTAVELLTAPNKQESELLSSFAIHMNDTRKEMTKVALNEVLPQIDDTKNVILLKSDAVHEGLSGIIAGKISEQYKKTTIMFVESEKNGVKFWKGSGRSNALNLFELLSKIDSKLIDKFGGHAGAAGISVLDSCFNEFSKAAEAIAKQMTTEEPTKEVVLVPTEDFDSLAEALKMLKPFGQGFFKPLIETKYLVKQVDYFYGSSHVKISEKYGQEIWLYGELENFSKLNLTPNFKLAMSNTDKRMTEKGLSQEEAEAGRWERWKAAKKEDDALLDLILELDYTYYTNDGTYKIVPRVVSYNY